MPVETGLPSMNVQNILLVHAATPHESGNDGGARAADGECTTLASNARALDSARRCGLCHRALGVTETAWRWLFGITAEVCDCCAQAIDQNRQRGLPVMERAR